MMAPCTAAYNSPGRAPADDLPGRCNCRSARDDASIAPPPESRRTTGRPDNALVAAIDSGFWKYPKENVASDHSIQPHRAETPLDRLPINSASSNAMFQAAAAWFRVDDDVARYCTGHGSMQRSD